jgi:hypothetical protein
MNASDQFLAGGQALNYGPTSDTRWLNRPRGGRIVTEPREEQQTDINTRQPLFWDDARTRPKMQLVFTVVCDGSGPAAANGWRTDERVDAQDPGHRQVYVKGKDKTEAIKGQIRAHARTGLRIGDHYYECWTGTRPGQNNIGTARTWAVMLFPGNEAQQSQAQFFGNEQQQPQAPGGFGQQSPPAQSTVQNWGSPQGTPVPAAQGNAYGFGHQPPASPGGQAFQNAQQATQPQAWAPAPTGAAPNPGPPPQFGAPSQHMAQQGNHPLQDHGAAAWTPAQHEAYGQAAAPQGFGQAPPPAQPPVPPVDNPWGQAPPAQNPYGG